jgi:hypothetical protein
VKYVVKMRAGFKWLNTRSNVRLVNMVIIFEHHRSGEFLYGLKNYNLFMNGPEVYCGVGLVAYIHSLGRLNRASRNYRIVWNSFSLCSMRILVAPADRISKLASSESVQR